MLASDILLGPATVGATSGPHLCRADTVVGSEAWVRSQLGRCVGQI